MATPAPSAKPTQVTVERGDTLSQIALDYLGSASKYKQLAAINDISNPNLIYVGQVIKLTSTGGSSGSSKSSNSNKPTIKQFGLQSNASEVLFATWTWSKSNTESYKVLWTYDTGDDVWFVGNESTITVDSDNPSGARQSTYSIPSNARKVRFKVKPISKKKKTNDKETSYWEAKWSDTKTWTDSTPLDTPDVPSVEIDKFKLTATLDNIKVTGATGIEFEIVKDNASKAYKTGKAKIVSAHASYSCTVAAGSEYKVRCRAYKGKEYSEWTAYSNNEGTMPAAVSGITTIRATSETAVYLEWAASKTAVTYDVEYTTEERYFDGSNEVTRQTGIESTHYEFTGLESGDEYFFRVRAVNTDGESAWTDPKSVVIGEKPSAPTTWSSTTTAIVGEELNLYWVHNSKDGSPEKYAALELIFNEDPTTKETYDLGDKAVDNGTIGYTPLSEEDREDGKTNSCSVKTGSYSEGTKIQWRVRTAGITLQYSDWSIQRTVDIYAPPSLELGLYDLDDNAATVITSFPFTVKALAAPKTQAAIGYHLSIVANEMYETTDNVGNPKIINVGDLVYSRYFDILGSLEVDFSAGDIDLENNVSYTIDCVVSMNSGLTAESTLDFTVSWVDVEYVPNAEIGVDTEIFTASIRPYCENRILHYKKVTKSGRTYTVTDTDAGLVWGEVVSNAKTTTGEQVYNGVDENGNELYFCTIEEVTSVKDVFLSVYRREFDGSFTELATGLDGAKSTTITDPHPALDYARYRIVAISKETGAVSYYDPPGYPVNGIAVVLQWDEDWSTFETTEASALEQPPWAGSMLKLPYNIDVSNNHRNDVALVEYIGRAHPVSYYGTQLGETATWNMSIDKSDKETLYGLRRLAKWMGDVYVREPSGSGYWANVTVSFNQKHKEVTIPVTLDITRVEGGA